MSVKVIALRPPDGDGFREVEQELDTAILALRTATKTLRKSRAKFTEFQSRRLAGRLAEILERLDATTRAAQSRFR